MRIIRSTLFLILTALALQPAAYGADTTAVHAILITASNEKAAADPKLAPYEAALQRNVPESSFRYVAEGSARVPAGGHATLALGRGHRIELENEKGGGLRLKVQWFNGANVVMSGTFNAQPGVPFMLGRRPSGNGDVPIVLVIAK